MSVPIETFAFLERLPGLTHGFSLRTVAETKADEFLPRLLVQLGFSPATAATAEQIHGAGVGIVEAESTFPVPGVDALITARRGVPLVIRCADCAPVYLVDPVTPAVGLVHSGKRGTLAGIVQSTLDAMRDRFGSRPGHCHAFTGPCIGPCHYEMDIASEIERQLHSAGVIDTGQAAVCTACRLDRYFSYRAEKGQTGRMFAVLALR
jgi:copper oxidase (laccase) domain-containing protein